MMLEDEAIVYPDFESALIGETTNGAAVYNYNLLVKAVMKRDSVDRMVAIEFVDFNIVNAYLGEFTPVIVYPIDEDDA